MRSVSCVELKNKLPNIQRPVRMAVRLVFFLLTAKKKNKQVTFDVWAITSQACTRGYDATFAVTCRQTTSDCSVFDYCWRATHKALRTEGVWAKTKFGKDDRISLKITPKAEGLNQEELFNREFQQNLADDACIRWIFKTNLMSWTQDSVQK